MKYIVELSEDYNSIIATEDIPVGECIGIWITTYRTLGGRLLYNKETMVDKWYETIDLGRYCNHSNTPNTYTKKDMGFFHDIPANKSVLQNVVWLYSNGVSAGEEIFCDYKECERIIKFPVNINF